MPCRHLAIPVTLLVLLLAPAGAQDTYTPKPLPAGPDVPTDAGVEAARLVFWRNQLDEECRRHGPIAEDLRADVETFVADLAAHSAGVDPDYQLKERLPRIALRLRDANCDVPALQVFIAQRTVQADPERARALLREAEQALAVRPPTLPMQLLLQASRVEFHRAGTKEALLGAFTKMGDLYVEVAANGGLGPDTDRIWLDFLQVRFGDTWPEPVVELLARMEKAAPGPQFALRILRGLHHVHLGWKSRGTGAAATVGEQAFGSFHEHLEKAAEIGLEAHRRWPRHPEGPNLVLNALGPMSPSKDDLRRWLDATVAAQFDFEEAYRTYLHYLQPRWGGSQQELLRFGLECVATKRFDTLVPGMYRLAIHYQTLDARAPLEVWGRSSVQKRLEEIDTGYLAAARTRSDVWYAETNRLVALTLGGRLEEAGEFRAKMQDPPMSRALAIFGIDEKWLENKLRDHLPLRQPVVVHPAKELTEQTGNDYPGKDQARPMSDHPRATTTYDAQSAYVHWMVATYMAAYDRRGDHDAAWDAEAKKVLDDFGHVIAGSRPPAAAVQRAKRLLDAGCDDGLVRFVIGCLLAHVDRARSLELVESSLPTLARDHSAAFAWWAHQFLLRVGAPAKGAEKTLALETATADLMVAAAADPLFRGDARRYFVRRIWTDELLLATDTPLTDETADRIGADPNADPWIAHAVAGLHYATRLRFTKRDDPRFAGFLKAAASHLEAAFAVAPEFPETAAGLILVRHHDRGGAPRIWLDRALDAQIDHQPAILTFLYTLEPQNGGSAAHLYSFARECLDSDRFDSALPMWFVWLMPVVGGHLADARSLWAVPDVSKGIDKVLAGYEAAKDTPVDPGFLRCGPMLAAWAGGRYEDAFVLWEKLARKFDPRWLGILRLQDASQLESDMLWAERQLRQRSTDRNSTPK
ncbi:MAG: DUF4034 domain-containing protein [Planctomycetes bacterium]|nr:DUF4034 domain-containing protein [Planctomycetota bacterium]